MSDLDAEDLLRRLGLAIKRIIELEATAQTLLDTLETYQDCFEQLGVKSIVELVEISDGYKDERDSLKEQMRRRNAPVSKEEWEWAEELFSSVSRPTFAWDYASALIAARAAEPTKPAEPETKGPA